MSRLPRPSSPSLFPHAFLTFFPSSSDALYTVPLPRSHAVEKARYTHLASWSAQLSTMNATVLGKTANGGPAADGGKGMGGLGGFFP